ncbi:heavy-metal-associated domain-containing protein [Aliikangiella sp. IMCC44359]|uniref:heavy-metal-associated domain-containing protein n=1 Tax=Aliikangiella sp. IMCC44359 TaxID=3459125 RepID=UPI00403B1250
MKKIILLGLVLSTMSITGNLVAFEVKPTSETAVVAEKTAKFSIENMTCKMCDITVRKAMEKVDGVIKATVDYDTKTATVIYNPSKAKIEDIAKASTNVGYKATAI